MSGPIRSSNSHGCVAYKKCRCPNAYKRCSLFTDWPELTTDPATDRQSEKD